MVVVGTGSVMNIVDPIIQQNPKTKIAVIDKDEPGGICLTRGCIPSKILLYPAEVLSTIEGADELGLTIEVKRIDFGAVMARMRRLIDAEINMIRQGLSSSENIDYYQLPAEFISPYTMKVGKETIKGKMFLLGAGSQAIIPPIEGLEKAGYLTSDSVLHLKELPESLAIIGGGYIAAEYGYFFASMGSHVTIVSRNPQFLPAEEPEVSALAMRELGRRMTILPGHEVVSARIAGPRKILTAKKWKSGETVQVEAGEILVAAGRGPTTGLLHPERAGIKTDERGWIVADEHLQTSQPNIWTLGDATGRYLFKHKANYDSEVVYSNAIAKRSMAVDYHAVPHAVFIYPEIAAVGLSEREAVGKFGSGGVAIGFYRYQDTAKGEAMGVTDCFVKILVERKTFRIVGAHAIGPHASVLIQEVVDTMYSEKSTVSSIYEAMHIHPALSEVVERAAGSLVPLEHYHHMLKDYGLETPA